MHSIIRIDEVEQEGSAKVVEIKSGDKVTQFPFSGNFPKPATDQ